MKTGRLQTLGGVQYGTEVQVQTTALVGGAGTYTNPVVPGVTSVEEAIDSLLSSTPRYIEVIDTPYLILRAGDYVCMEGSNTLYLGNGLTVGDRVSIVGIRLWVVYHIPNDLTGVDYYPSTRECGYPTWVIDKAVYI